MISKSEAKKVRLLHQKKYRDESGIFIAEGPKVVHELLNSSYKLISLFATKEFIPKSRNHALSEITEKELSSVSCLSTPNQVIGLFEIPVHKTDVRSLQDQLVIALDDIRDPGNLGTIIRIADWFGIKHILCSDTCVEAYNPKVVQATMGSIARVQVQSGNLQKLLKDFKRVYAAVLDGKNIYKENLADNGAILIGNESRGISKALMNLVTHPVSIPNFSAGADSLNAAVAAAVICSEFKRK